MKVSPLDAHVGFWLRFVSNHVSAAFAARLEAEGVTVPEWVVLRHLYDAPGTSPAALVALLGMTKGAISKIVARLEARGLCASTVSVADGRARHLVLTDAGRAIVPRLARHADENDAAFFGHLAPAERAALVETLRALALRHQLAHLPID